MRIWIWHSLSSEHPNPRPGFLRNPILKANLEQLLDQLYTIIACKISEQGRESNQRLQRKLVDLNPVGRMSCKTKLVLTGIEPEISSILGRCWMLYSWAKPALDRYRIMSLCVFICLFSGVAMQLGSSSTATAAAQLAAGGAKQIYSSFPIFRFPTFF